MKNWLATVVAHGAMCLDQATSNNFTVIMNEKDHSRFTLKTSFKGSSDNN